MKEERISLGIWKEDPTNKKPTITEVQPGRFFERFELNRETNELFLIVSTGEEK
jgi:hypothetical protein